MQFPDFNKTSKIQCHVTTRLQLDFKTFKWTENLNDISKISMNLNKISVGLKLDYNRI